MNKKNLRLLIIKIKRMGRPKFTKWVCKKLKKILILKRLNPNPKGKSNVESDKDVRILIILEDSTVSMRECMVLFTEPKTPTLKKSLPSRSWNWLKAATFQLLRWGKSQY